MFKKIVTYKNFWKSVLFLALPFFVLMLIANWGLSGFEMEYFDNSLRKILAFLVGGLVYGFTMAYIKYWRKLKEQEQRNK